jgi:hypothetical protein
MGHRAVALAKEAAVVPELAAAIVALRALRGLGDLNVEGGRIQQA